MVCLRNISVDTLHKGDSEDDDDDDDDNNNNNNNPGAFFGKQTLLFCSYTVSTMTIFASFSPSTCFPN
jgi:hypothetical protein